MAIHFLNRSLFTERIGSLFVKGIAVVILCLNNQLIFKEKFGKQKILIKLRIIEMRFD
jgi:hypothetical protein